MSSERPIRSYKQKGLHPIQVMVTESQKNKLEQIARDLGVSIPDVIKGAVATRIWLNELHESGDRLALTILGPEGQVKGGIPISFLLLR